MPIPLRWSSFPDAAFLAPNSRWRVLKLVSPSGLEKPVVCSANNEAQKLFATGVGVSHVTCDANVAGGLKTTTCEIGSANQLTNRGEAELLDSRRTKTCIASGRRNLLPPPAQVPITVIGDHDTGTGHVVCAEPGRDEASLANFYLGNRIRPATDRGGQHGGGFGLCTPRTIQTGRACAFPGLPFRVIESAN
jgi:hypothetical protein